MRLTWDERRVKLRASEESLGARSRALASLQLSAKSNYSGGHRHADGDLDEASSRVHCGKVVVVGEVDLRKDPTARPLIAERLHFLVTPGFDPRKFFDKSILQLHDFPLTHGRDLATVGEPPKVSRFVRARRQSLTSSRRWLRPISEGKFLDKYRSGFSPCRRMPRKIEWCLVGVQLPWWTRAKTNGVIGWPALHALLPSTVSPIRFSSALVKISVTIITSSRSTACEPTGTCCRAASPWTRQSMSLGRSLHGTPKVTVGLSSLAMGDFCHCCAVEFAQCSHLGLLLQHGVSKVAELLSLSGAILES